jgi:hypothetical protein
MRYWLYFALFIPALVLAQSCPEEFNTIHAEVMQLPLEQKSTVGKDQVMPVVEKIIAVLKQHPDLVEARVEVVAQSARLPFYNSQKKIDPGSDKQSEQLARQRAQFMQAAWQQANFRTPKLRQISFESVGKLSGPEFKAKDLNERFIVRKILDKENPNYEPKVIQLFREHQALYHQEALIDGYQQLMDDQRYDNLYQAKFKPFHGFRVTIQGRQPCPEIRPAVKPQPDTSKQ